MGAIGARGGERQPVKLGRLAWLLDKVDDPPLCSLQDPQSLQAVLNLSPFLEAADDLSLDDYYPQLLTSFTAQGQTWGLPADVTPFVIEYNTALFASAGVAPPSSDWTWDKL